MAVLDRRQPFESARNRAERRRMKVSLTTVGRESEPGTGFAFAGKEEKSLLMKEPRVTEGVRTFKGEGSGS
jgi:hypothetical protein